MVDASVLVGVDVVNKAGGVHLQYEAGTLVGVSFGKQKSESAPVVAAASAYGVASSDKLSRHVTVQESDGNVTLDMDDVEVQWLSDKGYWQVRWKWSDGKEPTRCVGSGIGQYPRSKLTDEQEALFQKEVEGWMSNGWLVKHDSEVHGEPGAVLPLLAVVQEHKASTPVRPCLDYRAINNLILSSPGADSPACGEKIRSWRAAATECEILDVRKAYLQVRLHPSLVRYQVVIWNGEKYVMERMGFGLSVAPKVMDAVIKYVTGGFPEVDNYIDDLIVPMSEVDAVVKHLEQFGLPTKPAEKMDQARVLGLQLFVGQDNKLFWKRREGFTMDCGEKITKRSVFSWCGKLLSHYPVCSWLRPACSFLKRLASAEPTWDSPASHQLVLCCAEIMNRLEKEDPVRGVWHVTPPDSGTWKVWCDASNVAIGVVLECNGEVVEDQCWLRRADDQQHINVAELQGATKALSLAVEWNLKEVTLMCDSKTVCGWLNAVLKNTHRVRVGGLYGTLVQRRLQVIEDLIAITGIAVTVEWAPSQENRADALTRVPDTLLQVWKSRNTSKEPAPEPKVVASVSSGAGKVIKFDEIVQSASFRCRYCGSY